MKEDKGILKVTVRDKGGRGAPIKGASVLVYAPRGGAKAKPSGTEVPECEPLIQADTDPNGNTDFELDPGIYWVSVDTFVDLEQQRAPVKKCECTSLVFEAPVGFDCEFIVCRDDTRQRACPDLIVAGESIQMRAHAVEIDKGSQSFRRKVQFSFSSTRGTLRQTGEREAILDTRGLTGPFTMRSTLREVGSSEMVAEETGESIERPPQPITGDISVTMRRTATTVTPDLPLWTAIRSTTGAISFNTYKGFMDDVMCGRDPLRNARADVDTHCEHRSLPYPGVDAYSLVKCATEVFLMANCGVAINFPDNLDDKTLLEEQGRFGRDIDRAKLSELWNEMYLVEVNGGRPVKTIPYLALIRSKLGEVPLKDGNGDDRLEIANCFGILRRKLENPCLLELIWSYWHEEGMLVQTMKAVSMRFQNRRGGGDRDPLMRFDIDPLRPLSNLLWGYIQDEQHRLTIARRAYEYDHHYGITLQGRAVPSLRAVDSRSKFLEAFHNLLHLCSIFFKEDDDTTVIADAFPVMNAIREVHLLLAEGAHNQFGDLPSTSRQEMLIEQWLLARPEMREFLGGRIMVPYSEVWMDRVDTVKRLRGWTDTTITDFHDLAVFGEQILLSIRYGHWSDVHDPAHAANWARYWRPEVQSYIHSYRAVTGVDLTQDAIESRQGDERYTQPSVHLRRRLDLQLARR